MPSGMLIRLTANASGDEHKKYALDFINRLTNDTISNFIDSVEHAHCSPPNSIFFINDSTGFFTEAGGCYASYNWLFRTNDRGENWTFIDSGSRTDGNSFGMLNNESFYMFNEKEGIIVWELLDGSLVYSLTSDGGLTWSRKTQNMFNKEEHLEVESISFSASGQITIVCAINYVRETERQPVHVIQSNNYGKSFKALK